MGVDKKEIVILSVSRFDPWKGLPQLIEIFSKIDSKNVKLRIVGRPQGSHEENHLQELEELIDKLGLKDRISFLGQKTPEEVSALMVSSDIFCQANRDPEPF